MEVAGGGVVDMRIEDVVACDVVSAEDVVPYGVVEDAVACDVVSAMLTLLGIDRMVMLMHDRSGCGLAPTRLFKQSPNNLDEESELANVGILNDCDVTAGSKTSDPLTFL